MFRRSLLTAAFLAACLPVVIYGQQTMNHATLHGHVLDATGAIIVGATITTRNTDMGITATVKSTSNGYLITYLTPGTYEVKTTAPQFLDSSRTLSLTAGQEYDIDIRLDVRPIVETIEVASSAPIESDPQETIVMRVSDNEITDVPLLSRNILDLTLVVPGVSATNTASTQLFAETSAVPGQGISINSQRNFSNAFLIDGLSAADDASGLLQSTLPLDAVDTLNIVTSGGQTEFGRAIGGYLNFTTKSGTNRFHGSAYGQLRNQRLNAANALSQSTLPMTQAIFGGSIGGPIVHDHAWLFLAAEQRNLNQNGIISITTANASSINATLHAARYPGQLLAVPTAATTLYPNPSHATNIFARFDEHIGNRESLTARYNFYKVVSKNSRNAGGLSATSAGAALYDTDHNIALSNVYIVNPSMVNETRAQYTHSLLDAPANDPIGPAVSISGVAVFGTLSSSPTARYDDLFELVDNVNFLRGGKHDFRLGADFLHNALTITYPQSIRGNYAFSSLANFQTGKYSTFTQSFGNPVVLQSNPNLGIYMQDEYRPTHNLQINAGVRYDLQFLSSISISLRNIAPRLGISWQPFTDKTIISAAYGLFFDRVPLRALSNALESDANTTNLNANTFVTLSLSNGQSGAPTFPAIDSGYTVTNIPSNLRVSLTTMDPHMKNAYAEQAFLAIEQRIAPTTSLKLSYQHVRGEHLLISVNLNAPTCTSAIDPINLCRPVSTYANNKQYSSAADSSYDSLGIYLVRRFHAWGSYRVSYTLSHGLDDVGEFFFSAPINNSLISEDWARSDDDQRHRVSMDAVLHSPAGHAVSFLQSFTHHWQASGILQYSSASPFNVVTGGTTVQTTAQRPCAPGFSLTATSGVNPCTLALPGAVIARNTGPGFESFNLNTHFARIIPLPHDTHLDIILEAFNTLNHRNNQVPNATFGTGTYPTAPPASFNQPTAIADPRSLQFAARFTF